MGERIKSAEWKQKQIILLIAKAMKRTASFQQLLQSYKQKKDLSIEHLCKKRRLTANDSTNTMMNTFPEKGIAPNSVPCHKENVRLSESEHMFLGSPSTDLCSQLVPDGESNFTLETSSDLCSGNYIIWEKLMEDDVICEDKRKEDAAMGVDPSIYVHELEDLIAKPTSLIGFTNVGEIACPIGNFLHLSLLVL